MPAWTTSPRTWSVGETVTAANLNAQLRDMQNAFGAWTSYTPSWTATTTNPVINNGTLVGYYTQIQKTLFFRTQITAGSTTTYGSGAYVLSLPATAASGTDQLVDAMAFDSSTGFLYRGIGRISAGAATITRTQFVDGAASSAGWTTTVPFTMASGDQVWFTGAIEVA